MRLYLRHVAASFLASSFDHGKKMLKSLLLVVMTIAATQANAEVFKCKGADGKVQFSDTACKAGSRSEVIPDRAPVTQQQQYEALQRGEQMQNEAAAVDGERAAARASQQAQDADAERKLAVSKAASNDTDAVAACVRDVERRGASQNVKAEMLAACRTAGLVQRSTGISGDAVSNCVKNVERTGASEKEKARQLALCHGGDVQPEPIPLPVEKAGPAPLLVIKNCTGSTCTDQMGNRYTTTQGKTVRSDGKRCYQQGNAFYCD